MSNSKLVGTNISFAASSSFSSFIDSEETPNPTRKYEASTYAKRSKLAPNDLFPVQAFTIKGARVNEIKTGVFLIDFMNGRYTSAPISEEYIHHILAQGDSDLINQGLPLWTVEEVQLGKFIVKRVNV